MNRIFFERMNRLDREKKTIRAMIGIYCRGNHALGIGGNLCSECHALLNYAHDRLDRCPFGEQKTACAKCSIHCYKPSLREKIKAVMRYAGPSMLWRHPLLAIWHCCDGYCAKATFNKSNLCGRSEIERIAAKSAGDPQTETETSIRKAHP